ncbi:MAG: hypothetical protein KA817_04235 [Flavobacteriales bacterium]|nr:hypothetical protein [Flavobacteriales bacterium]
MRRFLLHALLFGTIALLGIAAYFQLNRHFVPAPRITPNAVLNMKLSHLRHRGTHTAHVLAVGSSMTMNNLGSAAVVDHFQDTSFVNMGAWGMDMEQCTGLAEVLVPYLRPTTVLVVSNLNDLVNDGKHYRIDTTRVANYLMHWSSTASYIRSLKPAYYLREMERNKIRMFDHGNYEFMGVDEHGWAPLDVPAERISRERWDRRPPPTSWLANDQYAAVERLGHYLKERNIRLVFIQSPYRNGVRDAAVDQVVEQHLERLHRILDPLGHRVIDTTDRHWPDELFVDYSHLSRTGAEQFTAYAMEQLRRSMSAADQAER